MRTSILFPFLCLCLPLIQARTLLGQDAGDTALLRRQYYNEYNDAALLRYERRSKTGSRSLPELTIRTTHLDRRSPAGSDQGSSSQATKPKSHGINGSKSTEDFGHEPSGYQSETKQPRRAQQPAIPSPTGAPATSSPKQAQEGNWFNRHMKNPFSSKDKAPQPTPGAQQPDAPRQSFSDRLKSPFRKSTQEVKPTQADASAQKPEKDRSKWWSFSSKKSQPNTQNSPSPPGTVASGQSSRKEPKGSNPIHPIVNTAKPLPPLPPVVAQARAKIVNVKKQDPIRNSPSPPRPPALGRDHTGAHPASDRIQAIKVADPTNKFPEKSEALIAPKVPPAIQPGEDFFRRDDSGAPLFWKGRSKDVKIQVRELLQRDMDWDDDLFELDW